MTAVAPSNSHDTQMPVETAVILGQVSALLQRFPLRSPCQVKLATQSVDHDVRTLEISIRAILTERGYGHDQNAWVDAGHVVVSQPQRRQLSRRMVLDNDVHVLNHFQNGVALVFKVQRDAAFTCVEI